MILRLILFLLFIAINSKGAADLSTKTNKVLLSNVENEMDPKEGRSLSVGDWELARKHGILDPCKRYSNTTCEICMKNVFKVETHNIDEKQHHNQSEKGPNDPTPPIHHNCYFCIKDKSCRTYPEGKLLPSFAGECYMADTFWYTCNMSMKTIMYLILFIIAMIPLCCCICLCRCCLC
ncbi:unnamed protein product [Gordionus sp. m RMFG-2023]